MIYTKRSQFVHLCNGVVFFYLKHVHLQKKHKMIPHYKNKARPDKDMIFGIRAVIEAIQAGKEIDKILLRRDMSGELARELYTLLEGMTVPIQKVPIEKLNRITMKNHQGVIAFISPVSYQRIENIIPGIYEEGINKHGG